MLEWHCSSIINNPLIKKNTEYVYGERKREKERERHNESVSLRHTPAILEWLCAGSQLFFCFLGVSFPFALCQSQLWPSNTSFSQLHQTAWNKAVQDCSYSGEHSQWWEALRINRLERPSQSHSCFMFLYNENITSSFSIGGTTFIRGRSLEERHTK